MQVERLGLGIGHVLNWCLPGGHKSLEKAGISWDSRNDSGLCAHRWGREGATGSCLITGGGLLGAAGFGSVGAGGTPAGRVTGAGALLGTGAAIRGAVGGPGFAGVELGAARSRRKSASSFWPTSSVSRKEGAKRAHPSLPAGKAKFRPSRAGNPNQLSKSSCQCPGGGSESGAACFQCAKSALGPARKQVLVG